LPKEWSDDTVDFSVFALDHNELDGDLPDSLCNLTDVIRDNNCMLDEFDVGHSGAEQKCPTACNGLPMKPNAPTMLMKCFYNMCYAKCENSESDAACMTKVHGNEHLDNVCSSKCVIHCASVCPSMPCTTLDGKVSPEGKALAKCPPTPPAVSPIAV
jgi:hypothetical protein